MAKTKTHTGVVVRSTGKYQVKLSMTPTTWAVSSHEYYYRETGVRGGGMGGRARLLLDSIKPIKS
jgi:hypothetical protein